MSARSDHLVRVFIAASLSRDVHGIPRLHHSSTPTETDCQRGKTRATALSQRWEGDQPPCIIIRGTTRKAPVFIDVSEVRPRPSRAFRRSRHARQMRRYLAE